jgi:hypothetical protein
MTDGSLLGVFLAVLVCHFASGQWLATRGDTVTWQAVGWSEKGFWGPRYFRPTSLGHPHHPAYPAWGEGLL